MIGAFTAFVSLLNRVLTWLNPYNASLTTDSTQAAMIIWYTGSAAASISLSSTSYTFKEDGAADTSLCTSGVADISNAAYDTFGELADAINADTDGNWHATICAALRATNTYNSGAKIIDFSSTAIAKNTAVPVYLDVSANVKNYYCIGPEANTNLDPNARISAGRRPGTIRQPADRDKGWGPRTQACLTQVQAKIGNAGTTAAGQVNFYSAGQSGTPTTLSPTFVLADATLITKNGGTDWSDFALVSKPNERLVIEMDALSSSTLNSYTLGVSGFYTDPWQQVA